jgi:hypothetical protein
MHSITVALPVAANTIATATIRTDAVHIFIPVVIFPDNRPDLFESAYCLCCINITDNPSVTIFADTMSSDTISMLATLAWLALGFAAVHTVVTISTETVPVYTFTMVATWITC